MRRRRFQAAPGVKSKTRASPRPAVVYRDGLHTMR
jgi:hypothetical protein